MPTTAQGADTAFFRLHPLAQLLAVVLQRFHAEHNFCQLGFVCCAVGKIVADRFDPGVDVIQQHRLDRVHQRDALLGTGIRVLAKCGLLGIKDAVHALNCGGVALQFFYFGDHGPRLPSSIVMYDGMIKNSP